MEKNDKKPLPNELSDEIDSKEDKEKMQTTITEINIPEVNDIPGQENFEVSVEHSLGDETLASADEEGEAIFGEDIDKEINNDPDSNVTPQEKEDLRKAANDMGEDDASLREAALDSTDEDGTPLNEDSFDENISPDDLDVPGASLDDEDEAIGEEDEENNEYSLPDQS